MNILQEVYFVLLFITLTLFIIALKNNVYYVKIIVLLITLWLLVSASAMLLSRVAGVKNNLFIFHISTPLEYLLICLLYRNVVENKSVRSMINLSIPVFFVLSILFSLFIQKPTVNNSYIVLIEYVILIFLSLFYLREILLLQQVTVLHRFPMFWISVGILFYYTGNLIIEGMLNYMINHSMELALRTYRLSYVFKYLIFLLFIIGAVCSMYPASVKNST
ncbi:MAG: hypothetical protein ABI772_07065 [Bacteroidota bacterium]